MNRAFGCFALVHGLSALLLFSIQPMIGKALLPRFGGGAMVWLAALVFFQGGLLLGYLYARWLCRQFAGTGQRRLHLLVLLASGAALPVGLVGANLDGWPPILAVLALLAASIGPPYLVLSSTAPLTQRWYAEADSRNPRVYRLYALGNVGSILALLAYPLVIEPRLDLGSQSWLWSSGFVVLALGLVGLAWSAPVTRLEPDRSRAEPVPPAQCLRWVGLSLVPSMYLMGVTLHVTTDIAPAPFLWVLPLVLYLLSFVVSFARPDRGTPAWVSAGQLALTVLLTLYFYTAESRPLLPLHLAGLFLAGLLAHGRLAAERPRGRHELTDFYVWLALGGLLGGVTGAVLAPLLFDTILEYPLAIALACLARPARQPTRLPWDLGAALVLVAGAMYLPALPIEPAIVYFGVLALIAVGLWGFRDQPLRLALAVGLLMLLPPWLERAPGVAHARSFFGVYEIAPDETGAIRLLRHGTTVHGAQAMDPELAGEPLSYYNREGPLGQMVSRRRTLGRLHRIGAIGLGAGSIACYTEPGTQLLIFEIDPLVETLARDRFSFLSECAPGAEVRIGDGRLGVAALADGALDLLVVDAFSSDAIPPHLVTREALALYLAKLRPVGAVLFHVSNRYLDLAPVIGAAAAELDAFAYRRHYRPEPKLAAAGVFDSEWVVVARSPWPSAEPGWEPLPAGRAWTDAYSDLFSIVRWRQALLPGDEP